MDPSLSERGRSQALRLAMRLRDVEVATVYSSTARRALETASVIAADKGLPVVRSPQLQEIAANHSQMNGNGSDPDRLAAEMVLRFINNPRWDALRGFEPSREFRHRAILAHEGIVGQHPGATVVVVTHAGVINAYLSMILDIGRDMFFLPGHASISVLRSLRDTYAVQNLNDVSHLLPTFNPR